MMGALTKVVVDCSGGTRPDPVELEVAREAALEALRSGDVARAQELTEAFDRLASSPATRVLPLTDAEMVQRDVDRVRGEELAVESRRAERDALLAASDWRMLADTSAADYDAWVRYRQALRDLDYRDPGVVFPEAP